MAETTVTASNPYEVIQLAPVDARVRLTLQTGQPVMTSSILAATQVFVTPYQGGIFPVYRPTESLWRALAFSELPIQLTLGTGTQQVTTASNYDVLGFADPTTGAARFALSPAWASDTSIGTNPGSAERTTVAGIALNRWDVAGGPGAQRGTVLGSVRTGTSAAVDWTYGGIAASCSPAVFGVSNMYNRLPVFTMIGDLTAVWHPTTSVAARVANGGSTTARISYIQCSNEEPVYGSYDLSAQSIGAGTTVAIGLGFDSLTAFALSTQAVPIFSGASGVNSSLHSSLQLLPNIGFHFVAPLEQVVIGAGASASNVVFFGTNSSSQSGVTLTTRL